MMDELPILWVAKAATPLGTPHGGPNLAECSLCGLLIDASSEESRKINLTYHVGRVHPLEYLQATGNAPTPEWLQRQEYLVREGF